MARTGAAEKVDQTDRDDREIERAGDNDDSAWGAREDELCHDTDIEKQVKDLISRVSKGFENQWDRGNDQMDYWDCYNCTLTGKQMYNGNSQIYIPIIQEAVNARKTRFTNQIFPRSGRNIDVITSDEKPWSTMALMEHYVRKTKLRTQIVPALCKAGDIEGQYNVYVSWENVERHIAFRSPSKIEVEGEEIDGELEEEDFDVEEETTYHMQPIVEVLADCDVLVLPFTANSTEAALAQGGSATIIRRWTDSRLEQAIDDEEVDSEEGAALLEEMKDTKADPNAPDAQKKHADAAGIHTLEGQKVLLVYETWTYLKKKNERRLCRIYYGGGAKERILSVKLAPYWNDKCPLLSAPVEKIAGTFKGVSKVKTCADLQYAANDAVNMGWDSASYALLPIVMTDPSKNPRVGSMVLNLAAIWQTDPKSTQFAQFPQLWKDAFALVASAKQEIFQVLTVSPAAIAQSTGGPKTKRNQAEIANEQQVDILSTADVCTNLEDEILSPLLRWFAELDYQYRDRAITIRQYGELGLEARMEEVPILQVDRRYEFRWFGVEAARNAQMIQQQIAAINVVKGIPPQMLPGYQLNLVPFVQLLMENTFGSRLAPQIFQDMKRKLSIDALTENKLLREGLALPVHELDDDQEHLQMHANAMHDGDPSGAVREHMMYHRMQLERKMQTAMLGAAGMQRGAPGSPGGVGPGAAGTPRSGAQPGTNRGGGQNPPGAIHPDQMQGAGVQPRR